MTTHDQDIVKLEADGIVDLYQVTIGNSAVLYLKNNDTVTWQGNEYQGIAIEMEGQVKSSDQEMSRPKISLANPGGILSQYVLANNLESSIVRRFRMLRSNLDADLNIYRQDTWQVNRVVQMNKLMLQLELRKPYDGPIFQVPARMYISPEFPTVRLT